MVRFLSNRSQLRSAGVMEPFGWGRMCSIYSIANRVGEGEGAKSVLSILFSKQVGREDEKPHVQSHP